MNPQAGRLSFDAARRRARHYLLLGVCSLNLVVPGAAAAAPSLREALEAAWARSAEARSLPAARADVAARRAAATAWIPGAPVLTLAQRNDRLSGDRGKLENEVELAAPLWLPGQQAAREAEAQSYDAQTDARVRARRLQLAGTLRQLCWQVLEAQAEAAQAESAEQTARALIADLSRQVDVGEAARADLLAARASHLQLQRQLAQATLAQRRLQWRWQTLTGLEDVAETEESPAAAPDAAPHPALLEAQARVEREQRRLELARASRRDAPELGVQLRRERDMSGADASSSLRFQIRVPLDSETRNAPVLSAALLELDRARADLEWVERELQAEHHLAEQEQAASEQTLDLAERRRVAERERLALAERAWKLGAMPLAELLRVREAARSAELEAQRAHIARNAARARLNQALGVLP